MLGVCVCSLPRENISLWTGVFTIFRCSAGLNVDWLPVATPLCHTHITYVLKSCCFSLSKSPLLSAGLPSVPPISPLICTISPCPRREDCVWGPEAEEGSAYAGPYWKDPASARACGSTARTHTAPGEPWVNIHPHAQAHTDSHTHLFFSSSNLLSSSFDLTSFHFSFPQALPLSLCPLMSSKMTFPPAPPPRLLSIMAFINQQPFLHCQGSQVTNYWVTSQLWAHPWSTALDMHRWGNITDIRTHQGYINSYQ